MPAVLQLLRGGVPMKKKMLLFIGIFMWIFVFNINFFSVKNNFSYAGSNEIEQYVDQSFKESKIPGISVVIINGEASEYIGCGVKSLNTGDMVDEDSLFELGSNSKAFTALGILYLEKKGLLSLEDPVNKYIPELDIKGKKGYEYAQKNMAGEIKIKHLLYHTSGIPFNTTGYIPPSKSENALKNTAKMLRDFNLSFSPGEEFLYVSTNYDILGLVIQRITGETFEEFIRKSILIPLELNNTYVSPIEVVDTGNISKGHKVSFLSIKQYEAPFYRGNTPAGYFISNAKDMERWMKLQLGIADAPEFYKDLIKKSHEPDTSVNPHGDYLYCAGWEINIKDKYIMHGGNNPNYSSMIVLNPKSKLGVCILANINTTYTNPMALNLINILEGKGAKEEAVDMFSGIDRVFTIISVVFFLLSALFIYLIIHGVCAILNGRRKKMNRGCIGILVTLLSTVLVVFFTYKLYSLPDILLGGLPWKAVRVWTPDSLLIGIILLPIATVLLWIHILVVFHFPKCRRLSNGL